MKRKVLITGASRGIGRAIAMSFAREGDDLFLTCKDNIEMLAANGLTVAVMGTALFRNSDMAACIRRLHRIPAGKQQDRTADE